MSPPEYWKSVKTLMGWVIVEPIGWPPAGAALSSGVAFSGQQWNTERMGNFSEVGSGWAVEGADVHSLWLPWGKGSLQANVAMPSQRLFLRSLHRAHFSEM